MLAWLPPYFAHESTASTRALSYLSLNLQVDAAQHLLLIIGVLLHARARLHQDECVATDLRITMDDRKDV
jgi:hypothetical protein